MTTPMIRYENHAGESMYLNRDGVVADITDVLEWSLDVDDTYGIIRSMTRSVGSRKMKVVTYSTDARKRLYEIPAADVSAMRPGRLYVGEWYLLCYVTSSAVNGWWYRNGVASYDVDVTVVDPLWSKEIEYEFSMTSIGGVGLDFPYDFPHDFGFSNVVTSIDNHEGAPADAILRFYGPADECRVIIAGNEYYVGEPLESGEYVTINTYEKTVKLTRINGEVEDVFSSVRGEYFQGSGSYVFEKIPSGLSNVTMGGGSDVDIILTMHRDEPDYAELLEAV